MKKLYLLLLCILCTAISKGEVNEKTYNFSFNVTDFSITTDDKGITHVENMTEPTYFGEPNKPAIPVIKNHIQLDLLRKCVDISYETSKTVIARKVTLATAPEFSSPVDSASTTAELVLSDINGNIKDRKRINTGQQTTTFDNKRMLFSTLYVMSLFIDGKLRDAIKY